MDEKCRVGKTRCRLGEMGNNRTFQWGYVIINNSETSVLTLAYSNTEAGQGAWYGLTHR